MKIRFLLHLYAVAWLVTLGHAQTPGGTLLQFDFNSGNPWPQAEADGAGASVEVRAVGTIDVAGSKDPSGGILLVSRNKAIAALSSGPLALQNTETSLDKLTLSFSLSVSVAEPVTVRIESFDAKSRRSGGLETQIYPAAPDFHQRYALDLSTMKPFGGGVFDPVAPSVGFSFLVGSEHVPPDETRELRLDNLNYAKPAFYVSPQGNDANDGRTEKTAMAKPQKAIEMAQPGDIILVANGTYLPNGDQGGIARFVRPGTPANWIVLKNYPGHRPTFSAVGSWGAIRIGNNSGGGRREPASPGPAHAYLEIRGIRIRGDADLRTESHKPLIGKSNVLNNCNGIDVQGGNQPVKTHHIRIADNIVEYCSGAGISYIKSDWAQIEGNISRNNCWWMDYAGSGISLMGFSNFDATEGNYKSLVRNNVSSGNRCFVKWNRIGKISDGNGIIIDLYTGHLGRKLIQNNLVFGNGGSGIHAYSSEYVDIINNTAFLNSASPELQWNQIFAGAKVKDIRIINNIMWAPPDKPMDFKLLSKAVDVIYANNLYFGGRAGPGETGGGLGAEAGSGELASESGNVRADPQFVNATLDYKSADFRLQPGSPALKTGRWEPFSPQTDLSGNARPRHGSADLGAYQK